mmetsp:Transcript_5873/g.13054  ORF Transcript_5873/g.13054 Transcript_5873/m.13054 type:complete len:86 (+) Transcript_5873:2701-2958(+)
MLPILVERGNTREGHQNLPELQTSAEVWQAPGSHQRHSWEHYHKTLHLISIAKTDHKVEMPHNGMYSNAFFCTLRSFAGPAPELQ